MGWVMDGMTARGQFIAQTLRASLCIRKPGRIYSAKKVFYCFIFVRSTDPKRFALHFKPRDLVPRHKIQLCLSECSGLAHDCIVVAIRDSYNFAVLRACRSPLRCQRPERTRIGANSYQHRCLDRPDHVAGNRLRLCIQAQRNSACIASTICRNAGGSRSSPSVGRRATNSQNCLVAASVSPLFATQRSRATSLPMASP